MTTINTTRPNEEVAKIQARAEQVKNFYDERIGYLKAASGKMDALVEKFFGSNLEIGNMYSTTGIDEGCNDGNGMCAHATFKMGKEYANKSLFAKRMQEAFRAGLPLNIYCSFRDYKIKDGVVSFEIQVSKNNQ